MKAFIVHADAVIGSNYPSRNLSPVPVNFNRNSHIVVEKSAPEAEHITMHRMTMKISSFVLLHVAVSSENDIEIDWHATSSPKTFDYVDAGGFRTIIRISLLDTKSFRVFAFFHIYHTKMTDDCAFKSNGRSADCTETAPCPCNWLCYIYVYASIPMQCVCVHCSMPIKKYDQAACDAQSILSSLWSLARIQLSDISTLIFFTVFKVFTTVTWYIVCC